MGKKPEKVALGARRWGRRETLLGLGVLLCAAGYLVAEFVTPGIDHSAWEWCASVVTEVGTAVAGVGLLVWALLLRPERSQRVR